MCSEAGEVAGLFEKARRSEGKLEKVRLKDEIGDVLWNVERICDEMGWTLDEIMTYNVNKLIARHTALYGTHNS